MKKFAIFLFAGMLLLVFSSCGKAEKSRLADRPGKYAGQEIAVVAEEITPEAFAEALARKDDYNIRPVRKSLSEKAFQSLNMQLSDLFDDVEKEGRTIPMHSWAVWQPSDLDKQVLYYPAAGDYLAGVNWRDKVTHRQFSRKTEWSAVALVDAHNRLDTTLLIPSRYVARSTDDVFACLRCYSYTSCWPSVNIDFYQKDSARLCRLCTYQAYSWFMADTIPSDSLFFWCGDDLYCSGHYDCDYMPNPPAHFYRLRLVTMEEKTAIDRAFAVVYDQKWEEGTIYDDPRWSMMENGDFQPNVCAFAVNMAEICDGALAETFSADLYDGLFANPAANDSLRAYLAKLPEQERNALLDLFLMLICYQFGDDYPFATGADSVFNNFPLFDNPHSRATYRTLCND